jgi:hypothetical protein
MNVDAVQQGAGEALLVAGSAAHVAHLGWVQCRLGASISAWLAIMNAICGSLASALLPVLAGPVPGGRMVAP